MKTFPMKRIASIILLAAIPLMLQAKERVPDRKKDKDKGKAHCEKKRGVRVHSIEEFGFMVPPPAVDEECRVKAYQHAVVNFYQWYLDNQQAIAVGLSDPDHQKDLLPPFHVSYETLHHFYELIKTKYPDWISDLVPEKVEYTPAARQAAVPPAAAPDIPDDDPVEEAIPADCVVPSIAPTVVVAPVDSLSSI